MINRYVIKIQPVGFLLLLFLIAPFLAWSQKDPAAEKYAAIINEEELKSNLSIIASDAMEGRETGKRGQKMAAAFISSTFQEIGLRSPVNESYYQPITLYTPLISKATINFGNAELPSGQFFYVGSANTNGIESLPVVWLGTGADADIAKMNLNGKAVIVQADEANSGNGNPLVSKLEDRGAKMVFISLTDQEEIARLTERKRYSLSRLLLSKPSNETTGNGFFYITPDAAASMLQTSKLELSKSIADKKLSRIKPSQVSYSVKTYFEDVKSENVLGYLEGTDKSEELVVITAHYDHIGITSRGGEDRINNGADDDGSGTVAVLAMAKAFAKAKQEGHGPRRSILFMTVTGEEKGLLGSQYYTSYPTFPLENTVVNLNIDMIGRSDAQHKDSKPYVYVIGSDKLSIELHELSEQVNKTYHNLSFDYLYNDPNHPDRLYFRSDHWNFAKRNIPIIFYFDGIHEDYHKVSDEINKIQFDLLTLRTQTIFYTAWEIANRDNRLKIGTRK